MITCDYPGCTAQYRRKEHLTRHARKHAPLAQRLACDVCGKAFDRTDSLRRHRQLHRREQEHEGSGSRAVKACDRCHESKTRCDGVQPCGICLKRGMMCTFDRAGKVRAGAGLRTWGLGQGRPQELPGVSETGTAQVTPIHLGGSNARQTPIPGSEIQDLLLQHESNLREKGLLGTPAAGSPEPRSQSKDLDTDRYVDAYFSHFHYQWPLIHRASFCRSNEPPILMLAIVMIGLWVTGETAARERAEKMHEKLLALLENRINDWRLDGEFTDKTWPMTTYQTIVLNIVFAVIRDAPQCIVSRCRLLLQAVTTTCLAGGLFTYPKMHALLEPSDSVVYSWPYMEEIKRLALIIFKLNLHFNTGMLRLSDLQFPLPDSGYLWDAPETKDFYRRYHIQVESGTCVGDGPFICDIVRDIKAGRMGVGILFQADTWLGFAVSQAVVSENGLTV
ncbi:hypothetical protein BDW75DRAFT_182152 [Aspergillus navahoensis]